MDFWQRARSFAEEAPRRSQEVTVEAAKRSQEFTISSSSKLAEIVLLASKRSKEIATEASKRAKEEVLKRADQITRIPAAALSSFVEGSLAAPRTEEANSTADLEKFGVTDELRELAKRMSVNTFRDFPLEDDSEICDIPTVSNVQQDLTPWQERHAKLVLSNVEEISKLRYELCPRSMKERKFWRIYFTLVGSHLAPFEKRFMEEAKVRPPEQGREAQLSRTSTAHTSFNTDVGIMMSERSNTSSTADLDLYLLGDLGETDDEIDNGDGDFDHDDFL